MTLTTATQTVSNVKPSPSANYKRLYLEARSKAMRMDLATRKQLIVVYRKAAAEAAEVVKRSLEKNLSELTVSRWQILSANLTSAADTLAAEVERATIDLVGKAGKIMPQVDIDYVWSAAKSAGATDFISMTGLARIAGSINKRLIASVSARMSLEGYKFSKRIWGPKGVKAEWLNDMKNTISVGIAQGRDPVKIAKDIQVYTADGKVALAKRWGKLVRGTDEFARRLPGKLDWRAVRIVRSELYSSLQDAALMAGESNPGCTGMYDWILTPGRAHFSCECSAYAQGSPYTRDQVPSYPHPNCMCIIRPSLLNRATFVSDLKKWAGGEDVPYIDKWYTDVYSAA